jgi:hypothetical protein
MKLRAKKPSPMHVEWEGKTYKVGNLLSDNEKLKLAGEEYLVYGIQLAPHKIGGFNVCGSASDDCIEACIFSSGRGQMSSVQFGRLKRKLAFFTNRQEFLRHLVYEIGSKLKSCNKKGLRLAIRLNVFSDIIWEKVFPELFAMFPTVQFYDYSKHQFRFKEGYRLPSNYHLTYSRSENTTLEFIQELISRGINVAIPFDCSKHNLPQQWEGIPIIDGDMHDSRFMDDSGVIVGLSAKGDGKKMEATSSSFIVSTNESRFLLSLV